MRRREFLSGSTLAILGAPLAMASPLQSQTTPKGPELRDELSVAEIENVNKSIMAGDMDNFFGKGYNCAESGVSVALRFLGKPENLFCVASAFGGGLYNRDLCGFLTAGEMAIGLHVGELKLDRKAAREICGQKAREFWQWWTSTAPLHCAEIREGRTDYKVCHRLGKLAFAKIEDLIKPT
jgi:hypothetical protein